MTTVSPAQSFAFSHFTYPQLWVLSNVGISHIEQQGGCPHDCMGCGTNAPMWVYARQMTGERTESLAKGFGQVRRTYNLDFPSSSRSLCLFEKSDPPFYRGRRADGRKIDFLDSAVMFNEETGARISFTTAGWPAGNKRLQAMMEKIARDSKKPDENMEDLKRAYENRVIQKIDYSVKLFTRVARMDFDRFLDSILKFLFEASDAEITDKYGKYEYKGDVLNAMWIRGQFGELYRSDPKEFKNRADVLEIKRQFFSGDKEWFAWLIEAHMDEFEENSRYVRNLIENMKTLKGTNVTYGYSYISDISTFPPHMRRFKYLAEMSFVLSIFSYCQGIAEIGNVPYMDKDFFCGVGRAVEDFGLKLTSYIVRARNEIDEFISSGEGDHHSIGDLTFKKTNPESEIMGIPPQNIFDFLIRNIHTEIDTDGTLRFHYATSHKGLFRTPIPVDFFIKKTERYTELVRRYEGRGDGETPIGSRMISLYRNSAAIYSILAELSGVNVFKNTRI